MNAKLRRKNGNVLVIFLVAICFIVLPLVIVLSQIGLYDIDRSRTQSSVEAASLVAANEVSKIVLNDPHFGFVSLSNYPPIGKGTCAPDGEPLPVAGINTLVGTVRQNTIIANELGNSTMASLAKEDKEALDSTIGDLNQALERSLSGDRGDWTDLNGKAVDPLKSTRDFLTANLPNNVQLDELRISNGWLNNGGTSSIPIPQPERLAQLAKKDVQAGQYRPFVDLPADREPFTFAGLGPTSRLVTAGEFRPADKKHISSIVKLECVVSRRNLFSWLPFAVDEKSKIRLVACSQPFTLPDSEPKGLMTLKFTGGVVNGMQSWSDFLRASNFKDHKVNCYEVVGGDYPSDPNASEIASEPSLPRSTSQQFAEHLYCWLRNGHLWPSMDAVLTMINDPFRCEPNELYAYEFAKDGNISRRVIAKDPFPFVTQDSQVSAVADTSLTGGVSPIIIFRDNVRNLGTIDGGKHGGQPLAGTPLDWCELPEYSGDEHIAKELGKGRLATGLLVNDPNPGEANEDSPDDLFSNIFRRFDGKSLEIQPRRTFYSGGLALAIEIGGTRKADSSIDLQIPESKRHILARRKI